jgi:hypothetical protein
MIPQFPSFVCLKIALSLFTEIAPVVAPNSVQRGVVALDASEAPLHSWGSKLGSVY